MKKIYFSTLGVLIIVLIGGGVFLNKKENTENFTPKNTKGSCPWNIIISEYMNAGDNTKDWVEIYNPHDIKCSNGKMTLKIHNGKKVEAYRINEPINIEAYSYQLIAFSPAAGSTFSATYESDYSIKYKKDFHNTPIFSPKGGEHIAISIEENQSAQSLYKIPYFEQKEKDVSHNYDPEYFSEYPKSNKYQWCSGILKGRGSVKKGSPGKSNTSCKLSIQNAYLNPTLQIMSGDWKNDNKDELVLFLPQINTLELYDNTSLSKKYNFSDKENTQSIFGDWDNNGSDTLGFFIKNKGFVLINKHNESDEFESIPFYYEEEVIALSGDWDGNNKDTPGLYFPKTAEFKLIQKVEKSSWGEKTIIFFEPFTYDFPKKNWIPISGDWNGNGFDTIGFFDPQENIFHLKNTHKSGSSDTQFNFGEKGKKWLPVVGDWNGDGTDTIGIFDTINGDFLLRNSNNNGATDKGFNIYL